MYLWKVDTTASINSSATAGWVQLRQRRVNVGFEINLLATGAPIGLFVVEVTDDDNPNVPQGVILGATPLILSPPQSTTYQPTDGLARNVTFMFNPGPSAKWIRLRYARTSGGAAAGMNVAITQNSAGTSLAPFSPLLPVNNNPVPPSANLVIRYSAQNIDGTNNSSLTDGQTLGTWVNLGSIGAVGNWTQATAGLRPFFRLIAEVGKINNKSAVENAPAIDRWMATAASAFAAITQPNVWYAVVKAKSSQAGGGVIIDSPGGANRQQWGLFSLQQRLFSGGGAPLTQTLTLNKWQAIAAQFDGAASFTRMDGAQVTVGATPGANSCDGILGMAGAGGTTPFDGFLVELLGYSVGGQAAGVDTYLAAAYGSTPQ